MGEGKGLCFICWGYLNLFIDSDGIGFIIDVMGELVNDWGGVLFNCDGFCLFSFGEVLLCVLYFMMDSELGCMGF